MLSMFRSAAIAAKWHARQCSIFEEGLRHAFNMQAHRNEDLEGEQLAQMLLSLDDESLEAAVDQRLGNR